LIQENRRNHSLSPSWNSTVVLPSSFTIFSYSTSASAFTVAVPLDPDDLRVDVVEACQRGILTGLSIVPMSVSRTTIVSYRIGIGISLSFVIISIPIVDSNLPSATISAGSADSFSLTSGILVRSQWMGVVWLAMTIHKHQIQAHPEALCQ
jgi:hypothetical protein